MNRHAVVTGASSGIGLATTKQLLQAQYGVVGLARDFAKTKVTDQRFNSIEIDLSEVDQLAHRLATSSELSEVPDLLVLNAGYGRFGGIEQFSHQQIQHLMNTNVVSNLFLLKHFLPKMKKQGSGDIVLIGSESALHGGKAGAVYCASKFAIRGLAQSLRADCASANIRVMLINPGPVNSEFFATLNFAPAPGEEFVIEPEQVASAILSAVQQPPNAVIEEINLQPMKRVFRKSLSPSGE